MLILIAQNNCAQTQFQKLIHGKIVVPSGNSQGVTIVNLVNKESSVSDLNGTFYILAKEDDLLLFTGLNLEIHRKIIEEKDLKLDVLNIDMIDKVMVLEEVVINKNPEINALSIGVLPKKAKNYTQMERRLKTAGDFKPIHLLGLLGGSLDVDAVLNAVNGRTKMIKNFIKVESKLVSLEKLEVLFEDDFYIKKLAIPKEYIDGFQYYCIEDEKFMTVLNANNKINIEFSMINLALKYNEIILRPTN